jgi:hypothetical protein
MRVIKKSWFPLPKPLVAWLPFVLAAALWAGPGLWGLDPDRAGQMEAKIKVAYVYNLLRFVSWPNDAGAAGDEPVRICAVGVDSLRPLLPELTSREIKGRPIRVEFVTDPARLPPCHLLYLGSCSDDERAIVLNQVTGRSVLIVADQAGLLKKGVMIGFRVEESRVKIEVNLTAIRRAGLSVSAKLLEIARVVE